MGQIVAKTKGLSEDLLLQFVSAYSSAMELGMPECSPLLVPTVQKHYFQTIQEVPDYGKS